MLCATLSDGKQSLKGKRTACTLVARVDLPCIPPDPGSGLPRRHTPARRSRGVPAVTAWLPRHSHTTCNLQLRSSAACRHPRQALKRHAAASALPGVPDQSLRSPMDVLISIGMSHHAAEAALQQIAGDATAAAAERPSPVTNSAESTAGSDAEGSAAGRESTPQSNGANQQHLEEACDDISTVSRLCTEQQSTVSATEEQAWISGGVTVSGSEQLLQAERISAAVQGLLDAGVPVHRLAAVIAAHPAALVADPDTEWQPRVRCPSRSASSYIMDDMHRASRCPVARKRRTGARLSAGLLLRVLRPRHTGRQPEWQ